MNSPAAMEQPAPSADRNRTRYLTLRVSCWAVALALGAAQAWATRFTMSPDGISYLDIGDAYWRHDWHNAINAYWSPLYSWVLGFFINVIKPTPYWEYPLVHLVNFLIYVAALGCFEVFLTTLTAECKSRERELTRNSLIEIDEPCWYILGYSLFLTASIVLIGLNQVTPDLCISAFVYLISALILRVRSRNAVNSAFVLLGVVLGAAYLTKAVIFPLALVFVGAATATTDFRRTARNAAVTLLAFLIVASPFVITISHAKGRPTFGDSGKINYQIEVQHDNWFVPSTASKHPVEELLNSPLTYDFSSPVAGTYPLWYDPSYWHDGVPTRFSPACQIAAIWRGVRRYSATCTTWYLQLNATLLLLSLFTLSPSITFLKRTARLWPILLPPVTALLLYSVVVVELRYVAPFLLLCWLGLLASLRVRAANREILTAACTGFALTAVVLSLMWIFIARQTNNKYSAAFVAMQSYGFSPGDELAVAGLASEGEGGTFIARLGRIRIVAETPSQDTSWMRDAGTCKRYLDSLTKIGIRAVLFRGEPPADSELGWQRLGQTDYYVHLLTPRR